MYAGVMAVAFLEIGYVSTCQLAHVIGLEIQAEHDLSCRQYVYAVSVSTLFVMVCLTQSQQIAVPVPAMFHHHDSRLVDLTVF